MHVFIKSVHSGGFILPIITKWQRHPGSMSLELLGFRSYFFRASNELNSFFIAKADKGILPSPRHCPSTTSKTSSTSRLALTLPAGGTERKYSFSSLGFPFRTYFRVIR